MTSNRIGLKIKERRLELGLTQPELSEKTGVSQAYISRLEAGRHQPTFMVMIRICSALQITVDELTGQMKGS